MDDKYIAKLMAEKQNVLNILEELAGPLEVEPSHIEPILYCNSSYEEDGKGEGRMICNEVSCPEVIDNDD